MQINFFRKGLIFSIILILIGATILPSTEIRINQQYPPTTVYIDDDYNESTPGWGYNHFDNIQGGIDAVKEYGKVFVYNGIYYEYISIEKTITLVGEYKYNTIIDGRGGIAVDIKDNNVHISNFKIQNKTSEGNDGVINILSPNTLFSNNIVINNYYAVNIKSSNNIIFDNTIKSNHMDGIIIRSGNSNYIINNTILSSRCAVDLASSYNFIVGNNLSLNDWWGGIRPWGAYYNTFVNNIITNNKDWGVYSEGSSNNNNYYHNNFIDNNQNAHDECSNIWDNGYPSGGNYWNDYSGIDENGDGIGDSLYPIPGGNNEDNYPLMDPWENIPPIADFIYKPIDPTTQNVIQFIDKSTCIRGEIVNWTWIFSDGYKNYSQNTSYTFDDNGIYNVLLIVRDDNYSIDVVIKQIIVSNVPPIVDFTFKSNNLTIEFNASLCYDPDGIIEDYNWTFGDDFEGNGRIINHTYSNSGIYNVVLTVIDDDGYEGNITKTIEVEAAYEFTTSLIFGRINNLITLGDVIKFEVINLRVVTFFPFSFNPYCSGEKVTISKDYIGFVGARFIFAFCGASISKV